MREVAAELVSRAEGREGAEHLFADSGTYLACARMYSGEFELAAEGFDRSWELLETIAKVDLTPQRGEQIRRAREVQRRLGSHENNRVASQRGTCGSSAIQIARSEPNEHRDHDRMARVPGRCWPTFTDLPATSSRAAQRTARKCARGPKPRLALSDRNRATRSVARSAKFISVGQMRLRATRTAASRESGTISRR